MKIAFYMPFKPFGHKNPSGDLITGMELHDFLTDNNHELSVASSFAAAGCISNRGNSSRLPANESGLSTG